MGFRILNANNRVRGLKPEVIFGSGCERTAVLRLAHQFFYSSEEIVGRLWLGELAK